MKAFFCILLFVIASVWSIPVKRHPPMFNPHLFQGDILLRHGHDRNALRRDSDRWVGGVIYYSFRKSFSAANREIMKEAMDHISEKTCITFKPRTNQRDYIEIFAGEGCYSEWGRLGGPQELSIGQGCGHHGVMVHELVHAIGFMHEHSRSDRDDYLIINWGNIDIKYWDQFYKLKPWQERLLSPFDFDSIMLYGEESASIGKGYKSMEARDGRKIIDVPEKKYLSNDDILRINKLYDCKKINLIT